MEFIKHYYEKIIISCVLVVLIGSTGYLIAKTGALSGNGGGDPVQIPKGGTVQPLDVSLYESCTQRLTEPPLWVSNPNELFRTEMPPVETVLTNGTGTSVVLTTKVHAAISPIHFSRVEREWFNMLFKACSYDEKEQQGYNFQINFANRDVTFFVRKVGDTIKDEFQNTHYVITGFQRVITNVWNASVGGYVESDLSTITIQAPDEKPVVLTYDKLTASDEPYTWVRCQRRDANDPSRIVYGDAQRVRRGSVIRCDTNSYNVVDIKPDEMIIVDQTGSEIKVRRAGSGPDRK